MNHSLPLALIAAGALCCGSVASAQMKPAPARTTTAKTVATSHSTTTVKPAVGKPVVAARTTTTTRTSASTPKGRMVTVKTSTGKTVTYDCGKAGNATKTACKK